MGNRTSRGRSLLFKLWLCCVAGLIWTGSAQAALMLGEEPDPGVIISAGGYEWVWANPCAGMDPTCSPLVLHHDFLLPTDEQWLASFGSLADVIAAFTSPAGGPICASTYFSVSYDHCDYGDLTIGAIWHSPFADPSFIDHPAAETFLVRGPGEPDPVPEPQALALLAVGLLGLGLRRKRGA